MKDEDDVIVCPETYSISSKQVMPFLLDMPYNDLKQGVKPSLVIAALKQTTEECLEKLRSPTRKYKLGTKRDTFSRCPEAVIFQNFENGVSYTTPLTITNQQTVPKNIQIHFEASRHFTSSMSTKKNHLTKIAPGMSYIIFITFLPTDPFRDYVRELTVVGDEGTFIVPIYGLGPRPLAHIPDKIILPPTLVKVPAVEAVLIKNIGLVPLEFVNIVDKPFACDLHKAIIPPNGILETKYSCCPGKTGLVRGQIKTYFKNEMCVVVDLECEVQNARIELARNLVTFEDVFMGLSRRNTLMLTNTSDHTFNFSWKMYDEQKEQEEFKKLIDLIIDMKDYQLPQYEKLDFLDIVDGDTHAEIYQRILEDETEELLKNQSDKFLFHSQFFDIIPKVGKILPRSQLEFSVMFTPQQHIYYDCWAYLDIEGTEKRVRVSLQGCGIGPPVILCVKKLNATMIYLTDKHQYELAVKNQGVIPATVTYQPKDTDWGGVLEVIPNSINLAADSIQAFVIVFSSEVQGEFIETLDFLVEESDDHLQCIFTGNVVCPLLRCVPEELDFETVSVGLKQSKELLLINDSRVAICYDIEIDDSLKQVLEITPFSGKVDPNSIIQVKVTFSCEVISKWDKSILVIMWKSRQYMKTIPFRCICTCPMIICTPDVIKIKFCFLNCQYYRTIKLENQTDLPGYIEYQPQPLKESADESILCVPQQTRMYIEPLQSVEIILEIIVSALGPHELPVFFMVHGGSPQQLCTISCNGQGPVISYHPDEVDFGKINLLEEYTKMLRLVNDSPISAIIRVSFKKNSNFSVERGKLELAPEESLDVVISACFQNAGKIKDTLCVEITDSDIFAIRVYGEGVGTSIVCDPPLVPKLELGAILTCNTFTREVVLTNKSNIFHKLLFSKQAVVKSLKEDEVRIRNIFNIEPHYLELEAYQETKIAIKCSSPKPKLSEDLYYCHAIIAKAVQPELIMRFVITGEFVDPSLTFSKNILNFSINMNGTNTSGNTKEELLFYNVTGVPLQVTLTVDQSFTFLNGNERSRCITQELGHNLGAVKEVEFCPTIKTKRKSQQQGRIVVEYENHPKTDTITLFGEVMFPTIKLYPNTVDFHCIPLGSTSYTTVVIQNVSGMIVHFKWLWLEESFVINNLGSVKQKITGVKIVGSVKKREFMEYVNIEYKVENKSYEHNNEDHVEENPLRDEENDPHFAYTTDKYLEEMRNVLFPILGPPQGKCKPLLHNLSPKPSHDHDVTKWLFLEPSEGCLQPNEYSLITIGFSPPPYLEIKAAAICQVFEGEEEPLIVMGKSMKISYKLDKKSVNFGNQVFCEVCTDILTLTNDGLCCFEYKVLVEESIILEAEMLDVSPKVGTVSPGNAIRFKVDYFPGFPGQFEKTFTIELGYLEPVPVRVHGYAVVSQIYLHVPRLDSNLSINDCYKAVSWLTPEYLEAVQISNNRADIDDTPIIDPTGYLEKHEWTFVSYNEVYPSLMDIHLAMERIAAFNHVSKNNNILSGHSGKHKVQYIPNFYASPYVVDFGYVIRDYPVCYTVLIYNYGPINSEVKLLENNKSALLEKEFKIEFRNKIMLPGETTELFVLFSPTERRCKIMNTQLEDAFRLTVSHGPIISVKIKAVVTQPSVCINSESVHFGKVYCGEVLRKSEVLRNDGNVLCKWFASISKPTKKGNLSKKAEKCFFVIPVNGELEPGKEMYLHIYFAPVVSHINQRTLQIDMEGNKKSILVDLFGEGSKTILNVSPTVLNFPPTLSFFENSTWFSIQNLSDIPVEIYFPKLDKMADDEKVLIEIYLKYKNLKSVYIPFRSAGQKLPECFTIAYNNLVDKLRKKMIESKSPEMEESDVKDHGETLSLNTFQKHDGEDPFEKYSPEELRSLIFEYITAEGFENEFTTKATTEQLDDSADIEIVEPEPKVVPEPTERSAVLLIFHGAPTADYYKAATKVGIALSFPIYSIDRLIIESLVESTHPCAADIIKKINEHFNEIIRTEIDLKDKLEEEDNEYDKIADKIKIILTLIPKKGGKKPATKEKESKTSSDKSQGKPKERGGTLTDCFLNISSENIVDLLRPKLKQFPHLIIESLNGIFIAKPNLSLYTILKAAGAVQHIQLFILSQHVDDYIREETARLLPLQKKIKSEHDKNKQTRSESEKKTRASSVREILLSLNKDVKADLEIYEELECELLHICEYWDKRNAVLKKAYIPDVKKGATSTKKDASNKDSSRTIKSSVKKQNSATDDISVYSNDAGIYLWIVLNAGKSKPICEMIRSCIIKDTEFQQVLDDIKKNMETTLEKFETVFSVISKLSNRKNIVSPAFIIKNFRSRSSTEILRSRSKSHSIDHKRRRRSSRSSRKSTELKFTPEVVEPLPTFPKAEGGEEDFSTRAVLNPKQTIKYQITFRPVKCDKYVQTYIIEDVQNKVPYRVVCNAICELPRIDYKAEIMFNKTLENYREKASYDHFVYIKDQKIFDFGSVIAGNNKDSCQVYSSDIILRNPNSSLCEVTVCVSNDNFYAEPKNIVVRPKCEEKIKLSIQPTEIGTVTAQVYLSVKNNPRVKDFTVACSPCKLEFSISPKSVGFDKIPVSYKARRIVKMTNSSPINLRWKFVENDWNNGIFDLSEESGYIGLYSVSEIVFNFKPKQELLFPRRQLQIQIFDVNSENNVPCDVETITIHADSVEYNLEVESLIDYGEIKGGVDTKYSFPIVNKGKCEVALMFYLTNNPLEPTNFIREFFRINPCVLTLGALKTEYISVIFHPSCNLSVENLLLFVINMVESVQSGHIVKSYKVKTSATVFMPSYKLCPHSEMTFGYVQLLESKKMTLELTNIGRFSFSFVLQSYQKFIESQSTVKGKGKKEKSDIEVTKNIKVEESSYNIKNDTDTKNASKISRGTTRSGKVDKKKIMELEIEGFSVESYAGVVNPNETFQIEIEFIPREIKEYNEELLLNISEIEDIQKKKVLTLTGFGCEPKVNLRDFQNVFLEQYIVTNFEEFIKPKNLDNYCLFVSSEVALYFSLVCVNTKKKIQLHLKNIGFVTANITAKVDDFGKNVFSVSPANQKIDPYSACVFNVTFKPAILESPDDGLKLNRNIGRKQRVSFQYWPLSQRILQLKLNLISPQGLQTHCSDFITDLITWNTLNAIKGILEITYNASTNNKLTVHLFGHPCLPQIKLLDPVPKNNEAVLNFGPLCVGYVQQEKISFRNVGPIRCKVIVEILDSDRMFELIPDSSTAKKLNVQVEEYIADMKEHLLVNLLPDELAEFEIIYKPTKPLCMQVALTLHVLYNPFEVIKIFLNSESYEDNVIIDGLKALKLDSNSARRSVLLTDSIGYVLDFGHKEINKLSKLSFFIRNRSEKITFKFSFSGSFVTFIPEVGHLKPLAYKEVLVVFKSTEPVKVKEEILCNLTKIEYETPSENPLSWDDRQKFAYWATEDDYSSVVKRDSELSTADVTYSTGDLSILSLRRSSASNTEKQDDEEDEERELIIEGAEPECKPLPNFCKIIPLFLSVTADYSKYSCETTVINMGDTYVKERNTATFEVKNIGVVPLSIKWDVIYESSVLSIRKSFSFSNISENSLSKEPSLQSISACSLFSKEDSTIQDELILPITINPSKSVIKPGESEYFNVDYCPERTESFECTLKSTMERLDPTCNELFINVSGNVLPIPFYFEYEDGHCTNKDLVIQFESVGNGTECTRHVYLVNPHDEPILFEILPEFHKEFSCFICETFTGKIKSKKKAQLTFIFTPHTIGFFKTIYILKIAEKNVITNISLEGICRLPKVYFSEKSVILKTTVPKVKTVKSLELVNDEKFSIAFKFIKKSLFNETQQEKLEIFPIVGTLKPKNKSDIRITFVTSNIVTNKFNVKCMVEKLKSPLILNVMASSIEIRSFVTFTDKNGNVVTLTRDEVNVIDLGQSYKGRKETALLKISNKGQTGMFYAWKYDSKPVAHLFTISVEPEKGFVKKGETVKSNLNVLALRLGQLKQFKLNLDIVYGPNYPIHLNITSDKPLYLFSFQEYNFGYCFVQKGVHKHYNTVLIFKNSDSHSVLLENLFEKTDFLTVDLTSSNVPPGGSRNIPIAFHPQNEGLHQAKIPFLAGNFQDTILITGEGVQIKLELANLKDKFINFGDVLVDTSKKYKVCVINNTPARMDVHFTLFENLAILKQKTSKLETLNIKMPVIPPPPDKGKTDKHDSKRDKGTDTKLDKSQSEKKSTDNKEKKPDKEYENQKLAEALSKQRIEERKEYLKSFVIIPNMFMDISPHGKGHFEIEFQPNKRISFEEKIYFEIQDSFEPLCIVKGVGVSSEFSLDRKDMLFSGVTINCSQSQLITLKNTGDVIGSFNWTIKDRRNIFDIEPKQGFVMPNNDIKIRVTFSPKQEKCEFKVKAKCLIKEYKEPLYILLKANSIKPPEPKETIVFNTVVREQVVQPVVFTNTSLETWLIHPEISSPNQSFSALKEIVAPPMVDIPILITYAPKTMTVSKPEEGKMVIKLPNGSEVAYKLIGHATPPLVKKRLEQEVYCKENNYVTIVIENWLSVKQTFHVITEVISPVTTKTLYKVLGLKTIQLDDKQSKNYRWGVYLINDINTDFRVTFKNLETGEYVFYEICLKVLPAQISETIKFHTRVREPVSKQITLNNPVDVPVSFTLECPEKNLTFEKSLTLEPHTKTILGLTYLPLRVENISTVLTAKCEELGVYSYSLKLQSDAPKYENIIIFKAELGDKAVKTIKFKNVFDRTVEFSLKFNNAEFYTERCVPIPIGETSKIVIAFEPSAIGQLNTKLFLSSAVAGEYIYPLEGKGLPPTPKGPFTVKPNFPTNIEFKNPFNEDRKFLFQIQPDIFQTDISEDTIKARKTNKISIFVRPLPNTDLSCPITGKFTVYLADEPELEWIHYLLFHHS